MSQLTVSIIVYTVSALFMSAMGALAYQRESNCRIRSNSNSTPSNNFGSFSWEILLSVLLFTFLAGARWHTGYDHEMYYDQYSLALKGQEFTRDNFEPLFLLITKGFAALKIHFFFYFAFWGLLQIALIYYALRKRRHLLPWLGVVIMLGSWFVPMMNSMRQMVANCIFLVLIAAAVDRKAILYFSGIAIAVLLHRSAIILVPFYWLPRLNLEKIGKKRQWLLAVFAACIALGIYPVWMKLFSWLPDIVKSIGLEHYKEVTSRLVSGEFRWQNFGPLRLGGIIITLTMVWLYPSMRQEMRDDKLLPSYFALAFFGACGVELFCNTSHDLLRPFEYFSFFGMIMQCYMLSHLWRNKRWWLLAMLLMLICLRIFWALWKADVAPTESNWQFFYNFFFLK